MAFSTTWFINLHLKIWYFHFIEFLALPIECFWMKLLLILICLQSDVFYATLMDTNPQVWYHYGSQNDTFDLQ